MKRKILVTGGAGFIGSFLTDKLVSEGHTVRIIDNLDEQVHPGRVVPKYLNKDAEFINKNILDRDALKKALTGIDIVFHMASAVGVGQSQYEISKYVNVNCNGTALLWDIIVKDKLSIEKVIVPGSMTCFGEGLSKCSSCGVVKPEIRKESNVLKSGFLCECPKCSSPVAHIPTPSSTEMSPGSIYAISKKFQEDITLAMGKTYDIPVSVLRYFNVYGPRQSLSNPYTGVSAIFISRIKNGRNPIVYEDGLQTRDFISVHDVVSANIKVMNENCLDYQVLNFGSGVPTSIKSLGEQLIKLLNGKGEVEVTEKFRKGDIRHCYSDINELESRLNFKPAVSLEQGMVELAEWSSNEEAEDNFEKATSELKEKGLL